MRGVPEDNIHGEYKIYKDICIYTHTYKEIDI